MNDDSRRQALLTALTTEQFVLQATASSTISESSSRSSLYLLSLSSGLVALGFAQTSGRAFAPFAAAVLPTLFILGWFTVVRLVDTSIENVQALRGVARIRSYYAGLTDDAARFFPSAGDEARDAQQMLGIRYRRSSVLFTMASMIGVVNAIVGGTGIAVLLSAAWDVPLGVAVVVAVAVAGGLTAAVVGYEQRRFEAELGPAPS